MLTTGRKTTPHGTGRAKRREDILAFQRMQCRLRDASKDHSLPGDAPGMPLPDYYIRHLKRDSNDRS